MYLTYNCTASVCFCRPLPSLFLTLLPQTLVFHLRTPTEWNQSHVCFAPLDLCAEHFRFSCWKIFLSCSTQTEEATSVSLASCDRLRKPWGRSSTTVRLTGWPMSRSFLANITESSSRASRAEACGGGRKGKNNQSPDQPANGSKKRPFLRVSGYFRLTNWISEVWHSSLTTMCTGGRPRSRLLGASKGDTKGFLIMGQEVRETKAWHSERSGWKPSG